MFRIFPIVPAMACGRMAYVSFRTGAGWLRFRQWDAVATNFALGAVLAGIGMIASRNALQR